MGFCFFIFFVLLGLILNLGDVRGLDVSPDGSFVIGTSDDVIYAYNTATGALLWREVMPGSVHTLRIHGGVVVVPVDDMNTVVLDVATGHQLHSLPSAVKDVRGICVFDGLISGVISSLPIFSHRCYYRSAANEGGLEGG